MLLNPGLLLLLFSSLYAEKDIKEVHALVGSDVLLSCVHPNRSHFELKDLYVYWQIETPDPEEEIGVTFFVSENKSTQEPYKNRAHLSPDRMKQGDFSLNLQNVTPQDRQEFKCRVFTSAKLDKLLDLTIRLHVAANFSTPVIKSTSGSPTQGQEFTCMSTNGFPKPKLYWINRTDNTLIDEALQNNTFYLNERGLYDVVSILRVPWKARVNVSCCVENVLLHQNLTSISQAENSTGNIDKITEYPQNSQDSQTKNVVVFITLAVLLVAAGAIASWVCRSRCPRRSYTGPRAVEQELTDHA